MGTVRNGGLEMAEIMSGEEDIAGEDKILITNLRGE